MTSLKPPIPNTLLLDRTQLLLDSSIVQNLQEHHVPPLSVGNPQGGDKNLAQPWL